MSATISKDTNSIPSHIGFILDGNRRWARANNLPTLEGHRRGYHILKDVSKAAFERGVECVIYFRLKIGTVQKKRSTT